MNAVYALNTSNAAKPASIDYLAEARRLAPLVDSHAASSEDAGEMSSDVFAALKSAGLYWAMIPQEAGGGGPTGSPVLHAPLADLREATDTFQRRMVEAALAAHDGNWSRAATQLGVDRSNLHRLARRLGMVVPRGNAEPDDAP